MCWSETASVAMVGLGGAAAIVTAERGEPRAIWLTLGYFTVMEALQAAGYRVADQCGDPVNRTITQLSYLHIAFQPLIINAFAMAIAPAPVGPRLRTLVYAVAGICSAILLLRLVPFDWAGPCRPGDVLCGARFCLVSGEWHIGWEVPLNDLWRPLDQALGVDIQFPAYIFAAFILPLIYGAWRFVALNAVAGPVLASMLTSDPNEMPAVWCLFSIAILLIGVSPFVRHRIMGGFDPAQPPKRA